MQISPSLLTNYQRFVLSKAAPPYPITNEKSFQLLHCALGLATETLELIQSRSRENTIEEMGDLAWYLLLTVEVLKILPESLPTYYEYKIDNEITSDTLISCVEEFVSLIKKEVIYTKSQKLELSFNKLWTAYLKHARHCNLYLEFIIEQNQLKLNTRYQAAFTPEESETRKDKK